MRIKLIILLCLIILTVTIGSVCASSDFNTTANDASFVPVKDNMAVQSNINDIGSSLNHTNSAETFELPDDYNGDLFNDQSFTGLNGMIKLHEHLGEELVLDHDYTYTDHSSDLKYKNGIEIIKDNFVINGNGHTIDGKDIAKLFDIKANNIVIKNLNFINANVGNRNNWNNGNIHFFNPGTVENCTFINCVIRQHGTVNFEKGGVIRNSTFIKGIRQN